MVIDILPRLRDALRSLRESGRLELYERVDLRAWTPYRLGGVADMVLRCLAPDVVGEAVDAIAAYGVRWIVIGGGGGLVPMAHGIRIPILKLVGSMASWQESPRGLYLGSGASFLQASRAAARAGLSGYERLFGVPGTVGGVLMSAAAHHGPGAVEGVESVELVEPGCGPSTVPWLEAVPRLLAGRAVALGFSITSAPARAVLGPDAPPLRARGNAIPEVFMSDGSVPVPTLMAESGCTEIAVGGARQDPHDPNTVILSTLATAGDLTQLVRMVGARVEAECGCHLQCRLRFLDELGGGVFPL